MAEPVRVQPERFVAGGEVLAHDPEGRVVFVRGAVPGDDVTVEVGERKTGYARGAVAELHTPGPHRVDPPCPRRAEGCGGCDWQHVAVPAQLGYKTDIVVEALRRTGGISGADVRPGGSVRSDGYRTTVRVVGDADGRPAFRHEHWHATVLAAGCLVAHPALTEALAGVRLTPGLELTLRVSAATGEMTARWERRHGTVEGLPHECRHGPNAYLTERIGPVDLRVSSGAFFQSGPAAAGILVDAVRRAAPELATAASVLDAYAGVGLFAATVVPPTARITTVESSVAAVADSRVNLAGRTVTTVTDEVARWRPADGERYDVVVADPARPGLAKPGVRALVAAAAPVFVLVSCDPVSMARDTALLAEHGYRHVRSEVFDLFPHTHHVETVSRFVRVSG